MNIPEVTTEPVLKTWRPTIDIKETADKYLIQAELPGVKKEDIRVEYEDGVITLSGEKKVEKSESGEEYRRVERSYGSFRRTFNLGDIDSKAVEASFKDGILNLVIPKPTEKEKSPTRITVT